jgi:hypothetical protein
LSVLAKGFWKWSDNLTTSEVYAPRKIPQ